SGTERVVVPFATCGGVSTAGAYTGRLDVTFSGWGIITPIVNVIDAFYLLDPNGPSLQAYNELNFGQFRFSRASQGGCTCPAACFGESQDVASVVVGAPPPFEPTNVYHVTLDLGPGPPEPITFGVS